PGLECEHRQNCQGGETDSRITQCCPRQRTQNHKGGERNVETIHSSLWCTGKDSNLRTSEEGQIYSLLALTTHPPVQNCRTVRPLLPASLPASLPTIRHSSQIFTPAYGDRSDEFCKVRICKREEQKCARKCYRTQTPHLENSLMECRWKIC